MLRFRNLASGSTGNATVVEAQQPHSLRPTRLLVDCGPVSYTHLTLPTTPYV